MRPGKGWQSKSIYQTMTDLHSELGNRPLHRQMGSTQDIDPINLLFVNQRHRPAYPDIRRKLLIKLLTPGCGQLFGIVQPWTGKALRQDDRAGRDRAGERASTRLIHPHDIRDAAGMEGVFET